MPDPLIHRRRWIILAVLIVSLFTVNLDNTVLNVALPTLARSLGASMSELQWMVDAYVLVFAGLLVAAGALGDRFGRRRVLAAGLLVFGAGSLASAFAPSAGALIGLRALMGLGGALITPSTLSVTRHVFSKEERPKAIAIWTSTAGLGIVAGPVVAGLLLERFAWGSIFLINIPIVAVALAGVAVFVPETSTSAAERLDVPGALLSVGALASLIFAVIEEPSHGWTDPLIVASFAGAATLAVCFVRWELWTAAPLFDVRLFAGAHLSAAILSVLLSSLGMMGSVFFLSQYLQSVLGFTTLETGLSTIPLALAMAVASPASAVWARRLGTRIAVAAGLSAVAAGLLVLAQATPGSGYPLVALSLVLLGGGVAFAGTPVTAITIQAFPAAKAGVASAMTSTARELGGALGVAILGSIAAPIYANGLVPIAVRLPTALAGPARDSLQGAIAVASMLPDPARSGLVSAAQASFVSGMTSAVVVGAAVALVGAALAFAFLPGRIDRERRAAASEPISAVASDAGVGAAA